MDKRLVKGDKKIAGVCSGIADYFGLDPVAVRLLFLFCALFYGGGLLFYIMAAFIIPEKKDNGTV